MPSKTVAPTAANSMSKLTMGELAQVEAITGRGITDEDAMKSIVFMTAVYFIFKKRTDPDYTYAQAEAAEFGEVSEFIQP